MVMPNYGLALMKDKTFLVKRTHNQPGIVDCAENSFGVILFVVVPYSYVQQYRDSRDSVPTNNYEEHWLLFDAAMAWIEGYEPSLWEGRRRLGYTRA